MTTSWTGRSPTSYTQTTYDQYVLYDENLAYDGITVTLTPWTGRITTPAITNTVSPIVTGIWNDSLTWTETSKYWNDSGDIAGLVVPNWSGRIIP